MGERPNGGEPPSRRARIPGPMHVAADAQLVERMRSDDTGEALRELYRTYAGELYGFAYNALGERGAAEEIVQEVFLRLWNQPERFDPERGSLRSYLLAQTHGRSVDVLRADASRRRREERDAREAAEGGYDLDREVWDLALAESVRTALQRLHPGERAAVELAYFGGRTYREVADELGEAEGTVKSRIRSGLKRLRSELIAAGVTVGDA
jgi:RNA polymerase sigma-70 factor, ECF subfamily